MSQEFGAAVEAFMELREGGSGPRNSIGFRVYGRAIDPIKSLWL